MKGFINTLKSEFKAVVTGTQLTKNYDMEKEPYMHAGLHGVWSVYRAMRRGREEGPPVSIFMLDKRSWDKKKSEVNVLGSPSPNMKDDAIGVLKKDPMGLKLLRHPSVLNLVEPPGEDEKFLVFITEAVECSLACLADTKTKDYLRDKIPSKLEIKCMMLELLEALNFMH